ncbi:enoyl-CoA hydratase/isomerase family protein [Accumulibacter sp.]|uniref:enoyl-CoA hydratase/isomerase family protein n=1 Tax=Accumulibacter sp. TaxID=2053492 RepID=UPI0025E3DF74|nr:enoyl-CoA hydratase-related protein [Accumulibacter sp.]MCM8596737.1 enoyl-CoA hydratase-related protein [Accumulibacter sp.]MCM8624729.1 enoyl-CoA hydratase-related protein [Accumulibacter sp.]MDS4050886.1 enoyl-CoA hydratase-related protein [Accumulibacter sp.]
MSTVVLEISDEVAVLTLNRPESLNALNLLMIEQLRELTTKIAFDPQVRAVVLRGAGDHFMAGGDLKWFREQLAQPPHQRQARFEGMLADLHASVLNLRGMGKPVVAGVQGAVAGFGMSLMMACDLVLAADNAYFTLAYCNIGLSPDGGATWSLPRQVGLRQAMEIALLGERFDAIRARELGLVNRVLPLADLASETLSLARRMAAGPAGALARTKALLNQSLAASLEAQLHAEQRAFAACGAEPDFREGLAAFFERRPANYARG